MSDTEHSTTSGSNEVVAETNLRALCPWC